MTGDIFNQMDWSGYFRSWSEQLSYCDSEEDLYKKLMKFKEEFNSAYGKLSRKEREECIDRSLWTGKCQSCRHILKGISDEPCRSCDNHNSGWEARE